MMYFVARIWNPACFMHLGCENFPVNPICADWVLYVCSIVKSLCGSELPQNYARTIPHILVYIYTIYIICFAYMYHILQIKSKSNQLACYILYIYLWISGKCGKLFTSVLQRKSVRKTKLYGISPLRPFKREWIFFGAYSLESSVCVLSYIHTIFACICI